MLEIISYYELGRGIHINAFTDAYSFNDWEQIYFLSIAGHDSAVKAISSALVNGRKIDIQTEPSEITIQRTYPDSYRILTAKLPSGFLHQIVCHEDFFKNESRRKLIFIPEENYSKTIFAKIQEICPLPAIPEWSEYICSHLQEAGHLNILKGNIRIAQLEIDEIFLDQVVSEGVSSGKLKF